MSGLYLIAVVLLWSWLTWWLFRLGWRLTNRTAERRGVRMALSAGLVVIWLAASFWYGGGRIYYYDWQVRRMCAVDGGVKVYETVILPPAKFDRYGNVGVQNERYAGPLDEYYFKTEDKYLRIGNPTLIRSTTRIVRRSDGMVLGEATRYGRGGGDMHGPWHPSTFDCPSIKEIQLESSIFIKGIRK